jgi:hypothetical protein
MIRPGFTKQKSRTPALVELPTLRSLGEQALRIDLLLNLGQSLTCLFDIAPPRVLIVHCIIHEDGAEIREPQIPTLIIGRGRVEVLRSLIIGDWLRDLLDVLRYESTRGW